MVANTGRFGCEPAGDEYKCIDWMLVSEQFFGTALDQDIMGEMIMEMPLLEVMKIPKTAVTCYLLDGQPMEMSQCSHFRLKMMKPGMIRDKPDEHLLFYDPRSKNHYMCQVAGKALCILQAIHIGLCLRCTLGEVAFERTKALYFYTDAQGTETQLQT